MFVHCPNVILLIKCAHNGKGMGPEIKKDGESYYLRLSLAACAFTDICMCECEACTSLSTIKSYSSDCIACVLRLKAMGLTPLVTTVLAANLRQFCVVCRSLSKYYYYPHIMMIYLSLSPKT